MSENNIPSVLKHWATTQPEKEVFIFFDENGRTTVLTAQDVYLLAGRFATSLKKMGFQTGDLISNAIPNSPERVVTDFGVVMAGCIPSNCQIMTKDGSDFWKSAQYHEITGVILPHQEKNSAYTLLRPFLPPELPASRWDDVTIPEAPTIKRIIRVDRLRSIATTEPKTSFLDSLRQSTEEIFTEPEMSPTSIACIFSTSGTTGFSKMSPRSHEDILRTSRANGDPPSIRICQRPLGWGGGYPFSFLGNCSSIVMQDRFEGNPELSQRELWDVTAREGCTTSFMVPSEIGELMEYFRKSPPTHKLTSLLVGGQPMTKKITDALGILTEVLIIVYASTEMSGVTATVITSPDQMQDFMAGRPLPGVSLKIVNDRMEEVAPGTPGLILVKSPNVVTHYYKLTKKTTTDDGYFISGDRGWLDQDGILFVCDRNDDVIHHGSIMVYPSWPESVLSKIPDISEVAVVGIPQGDGGDKLCACVVLQSGSTLTKDSLISTYDSYFIGPDDEFYPKLTYVEFFSSLPKGETGKVSKRKLREMVMNMDL